MSTPPRKRRALLNRRRALAYADARLDLARRMVVDDDGYLPSGHWYGLCEHLHQARSAYAAAGLGLLAGRLAYLHRRVMSAGMDAARDERVEVRSLWRFFDRLNDATRLSMEGGRK